ncbi:transcriptional regulator [Paucibacter sp. KBW04]|uniref:TfoX/Sxy family protein n=1 Tax=Paucibacter sp. KBW04 TaxID=2153361 RepID=UPI000F576CCD|nr:TfoX/Sxy family protein [Paucibacter sp. KBW04]RQO56237.1 transcriptional regulator [Paucibacter sp. KBW04]
MPISSDLLNRTLKLLEGLGPLRTRKMFGGVYIYCDDLFIATVHDKILYFKANASTAPAFQAKNLPIFSYPKEGGVATLQYFQAPPEVFDDPAEMKLWAETALKAAKQDATIKAAKRELAHSRAISKKAAPKQGCED